MRLDDAELDALEGQPYIIYVLYLYLRRYMDYATGYVGLKRGISYQALSEALYIEPEPGIQSGSPHKSAIRRALARMEKSGLITSKGNDARLVFFLPFAETDISAQKQADTIPTQLEQANKRLSEERNEQADTHPLSVNKYIYSSSSIHQPVLDDDENKLIYPQKLTPKDRQGIAKMLCGFTESDAQLLLDELAGQMAAKQIANVIGYMSRMKDQHQSGHFVPQRAWQTQQAREQAAALERQREESKKAVLQGNTAKTQPRPAGIPAETKAIFNSILRRRSNAET